MRRTMAGIVGILLICVAIWIGLAYLRAGTDPTLPMQDEVMVQEAGKSADAAPTLELFGLVLHAESGAVIPGATVEIHDVETGYRASAKADEEGAFRIRTASVTASFDNRVLVCEVPGFDKTELALTSLGPPLGGARRLDVELVPLAGAGSGLASDVAISGTAKNAVVEGRLLVPSGSTAPILFYITAQALERPTGQAPRPHSILYKHTYHSAEDQKFRIAGLHFGTTYCLRVRSDAFADFLSMPFRIELGAGAHRVDVALARGSTVRGRVQDPNGVPIRRAKVQVHRMPDVAAGESPQISIEMPIVAGDDGTFVLPRLAAGEHLIATTDILLTPPQLGETLFVPDKLDAHVTVTVDGVNDLDGVLLVTKDVAPPDQERWIAGRVFREDGSPGVGCEVRVMPGQGGEYFRVRTGPDGRFRVEELEGARFNVSARCENETVALRDVLSGSEITLRLTTETRISGVVVDSRGVGVKCTVVLMRERMLDEQGELADDIKELFSQAREGSMETGEDGTFSLLVTLPGRYVVRAKYEAGAQGNSEAIDIAAGKSRSGVRIVLGAGSRLAGTVVSSAGVPIGMARVEIKENSAEHLLSMDINSLANGGGDRTTVWSKADGRFAFSGIEPGEYELSVSHENFLSRTETVDMQSGQDMGNLRLVLEVGGCVEGAPIPIAGQKVGLHVLLASAGHTYRGTTELDGRFRICGVRPGEYNVVVAPSQDELEPNAPGWSVLVENERSSTVNFAPLGQTVRVEVAFHGMEGRTLMMHFSRMDEPEANPIAALSAGEGKFVVAALLPGNYTVTVYGLDVSNRNSDAPVLEFSQEVAIPAEDFYPLELHYSGEE